MNKKTDILPPAPIRVKLFHVELLNPVSSNALYATDFKTGRRFMTKDGREYSGYWKPKPKRMPVVFGKDFTKERRGKIWIPGRIHWDFVKAGVPFYPPKTKVVIDSVAQWKNKIAKDMSNLQKPIEDAFQNGGFIENDSYLLWRNIDFNFGATENFVSLTIYEADEDALGCGRIR